MLATSKIAITGHTSGIGQGLFKAFENLNHDVIGYSRLNGYNLAEPGTITNIISSIRDLNCDTLIINAYYGYSQIELLYSAANLWKNDPDKTIITISSNSGDGIKNFSHPYAIHKSALDKAAEQLANFHAARIINIRPGFVDTPMVATITNYPKMSIERVVEVVIWAWSMPRDCVLKNITVTPRV